MFRIKVTVFLVCSIISFGYAQDSAKKAVQAKAAPVKTFHKSKAYKYHPKADSAAIRAAAMQIRPSVTDTTPPAPITDKSLNGQYQYLLAKVYFYQQPLISALWKNASDTLNVTRRKLREAESKLTIQNKIVDSLKTEITNKDQTITASNKKIDAVRVLGILLSKTTYNLIVWGLVLLFGLIALVVIIRSGSHSREARNKTQLYAELEEEFKAYKAKATDKELKLARELQTERNKLDELLGRG